MWEVVAFKFGGSIMIEIESIGFWIVIVNGIGIGIVIGLERKGIGIGLKQFLRRNE